MVCIFEDAAFFEEKDNTAFFDSKEMHGLGRVYVFFPLKLHFDVKFLIFIKYNEKHSVIFSF